MPFVINTFAGSLVGDGGLRDNLPSHFLLKLDSVEELVAAAALTSSDLIAEPGGEARLHHCSG